MTLPVTPWTDQRSLEELYDEHVHTENALAIQIERSYFMKLLEDHVHNGDRPFLQLDRPAPGGCKLSRDYSFSVCRYLDAPRIPLEFVGNTRAPRNAHYKVKLHFEDEETGRELTDDWFLPVVVPTALLQACTKEDFDKWLEAAAGRYDDEQWQDRKHRIAQQLTSLTGKQRKQLLSEAEALAKEIYPL